MERVELPDEDDDDPDRVPLFFLKFLLVPKEYENIKLFIIKCPGYKAGPHILDTGHSLWGN